MVCRVHLRMMAEAEARARLAVASLISYWVTAASSAAVANGGRATAASFRYRPRAARRAASAASGSVSGVGLPWITPATV